MIPRVLLLAAVLMAGCATTPAPTPINAPAAAEAPLTSTLASIYADLGRSGGRVYALDPAASTVRIYAFRAGSAARLGHNHVLSAPLFDGFAWLPSNGLAGARFDLQFTLDQLELDRPDLRAALGAAFAATIPPEAIAQTRNHLLGEDGFQASRFPTVRVRSLQVAGELPRLATKVEVEMHGQRREQWIALAVEGLPGELVASGSFVLRQTDFGVKPYSVLGGALAVQDEVVVEFKLVGRP